MTQERTPAHIRRQREKRRQRLLEHSDCMRAAGMYNRKAGDYQRVSREDFEARISEIPEDTRDLTAQFMGDPIPGDDRRARYG